MYAVLCFLMLLIGAEIGVFVGYLLWGKAKKAKVVPEQEPGEEEIERIRKEREDLIASQNAFRAMMGYNADIAYGISAEDDLAAGGS